MKKVLFAAFTAGLIFSGSAMAQTVFSVNVVGFQKVTIPPGSFAFASSPFMTATNNLNGVIGEQGADVTDANGGDSIYTWDGAAYTRYVRLPGSGVPPGTENQWVDAGTFALPTDPAGPGTGYIYFNSLATTQEIVMVGEVVDGALNSTTTSTNTIPQGLWLVSYDWSSDIALNSSSLTNETTVTQGDEIFTFDTDTQAYTKYTYFANVGDPTRNYRWLNATTFDPATHVLETGSSFFYRNLGAGDVVWTEDQPYSLD